MPTVLFLVEKIESQKLFFKSASLHFSHVWKICILKKTSNGNNFGWLIRQMSINQKSGRKMFRRRFVSGSLIVSPCPPECYFQSETKIGAWSQVRSSLDKFMQFSWSLSFNFLKLWYWTDFLFRTSPHWLEDCFHAVNWLVGVVIKWLGLQIHVGLVG